MATVKPPYNDMTYLADYIVILKVSLYPIFIYKMYINPNEVIILYILN